MKHFPLKSVAQLPTFAYSNFMSRLPSCLLSLPHCSAWRHTPLFHLFIRCILNPMYNCHCTSTWLRDSAVKDRNHTDTQKAQGIASFGLLFVRLTPLCYLWLTQAPCSGRQVFTSSSRSPSITKASRSRDSSHSRNWGGKLLTGLLPSFCAASFFVARGSVTHGGVLS